MRKIMLLWICIAALVSFSSACGDDDAKAADPVSLEDMPQAQAEMLCERVFSCCATDEISELLSLFDADISTEQECVSLLGAEFVKDNQETQEGIEAGRLVYHADKAGACRDEMKNAACSKGVLPDDSFAPSCEQALEGQVDKGGDCVSSEECRAGGCLGVERDDNGKVSEMGTCSGPGDVGDTCDWLNGCKDGNYCEQGADGAPSTCQKVAEVGEACKQFGCVEEAYCDVNMFDSSASETCKAYKTLGDTCSPGAGQCDPESTVCMEQASGDSECAALKAIDEACETDGECKSDRCEVPDGESNGDSVCLKGGDQMCMGA